MTRAKTRKRPVAAMRIREPLMKKLRVAAAKSDRSISGEIEFRLEKSFTDTRVMERTIKQAVRVGMEELVYGSGRYIISRLSIDIPTRRFLFTIDGRSTSVGLHEFLAGTIDRLTMCDVREVSQFAKEVQYIQANLDTFKQRLVEMADLKVKQPQTFETAIPERALDS